MGVPTMFNGKKRELASHNSITCPECGREFTHLRIVNIGEKAKKECPYCGTEIRINNRLSDKSPTRRNR